MMKQVYLILAAMLLLCLAPMPYGYFMLVRFVMMVACGAMAYRYYIDHKTVAAWIFGALALLFQPIYKIALGRGLWNVIDVLAAVLFIAMFVMEKRLANKTMAQKQQLSSNDMKIFDNNEFEFSLKGRLSPKELVYVASEEDKTLTELFEKRPEILEGWGKMIGFQIVYLPLLIKRLKDKQVLQYRAPYLSDAELADVTVGRSAALDQRSLVTEGTQEGRLQGKNDFLLQYLENPADRKRIKQGLIRTENILRGSDGKDKALNRFYPLSSVGGEPIADQLFRIGRQIASEQAEYQKQHPRYDDEDDEFGGPEEYDDWEAVTDAAPDADASFNSQQDDENIDDLLEEVRERIAKLRQRGISEYILEQLIHPDDRLSRMVITKDWRIMLPDYNDMEIKMEPLVKAVYLLFLLHPEGIAFKSLPDYRQELTEIYAKLRPLGLSERAMQSIEDVTNPLLNSINEKCARIRGAFLSQFDNHMAKSYYIDGIRGEAKKISLPRNLVVWE